MPCCSHGFNSFNTWNNPCRSGPRAESGAYDKEIRAKGRVGDASERPSYAVVVAHLGLDARELEWKGERVVPMLPLGGAPTTAYNAKHARGSPSGMLVHVYDLPLLMVHKLFLLTKTFFMFVPSEVRGDSHDCLSAHWRTPQTSTASLALDNRLSLQSCLKVANEAPADLRSNLQRSWAMFDQEKLDSCTAAKEFRACLFGLCFFHSLVLGRRRFGQLGWSRSYGFTTGDLTICANILQSYWEVAVSAAGRGAPWQELRYIFGEIMYGGHITDFFDRRVIISYLEVSLFF